MQKLIELIGLGDGEGNTSTMRVVTLLIVLAVLVPKVVIAIQTRTPPDWNPDDLMILGAALGGKLIQNSQEKAPAQVNEPKSP